MKPKKILIVKIKGYRGLDTSLLIEPLEKMYLVINSKTGVVLDYGYRSFKEAEDTYTFNDGRYEILNDLTDLENGV